MIFIKNILSVSSINIVSQLLPFLFLPYFSEAYSLESFGELAFFTSISIIIGNIISFRLEVSLYNKMNESRINDIKNIILLNTALVMSVITLVILFFNYNLLYLLLSLQIFLVSMTNTDFIIKNINKEYNKINKANITRAIILILFQLFFALNNNKDGLIYGYVISWLFYYLFLKEKIILQELSKTIKIIQECIDILKYNFTGMIANTLSGNIITLFMPYIFGMDSLGLYSMAQRIMGAPSSLVGMAIGNVYASAASQEYRKSGNVKETFKNTLLILLTLIIIGLLIYLLFMENILDFWLSDKWAGLIDYANVLLIYFVMNFVYISVVGTDIILKKNKYYLYVNLLILLISVTNLLILDVSLVNFLLINSSLIASVYLIYIAFLIRKIFNE